MSIRKIKGFSMVRPQSPLQPVELEIPPLNPGEVIVKIAGCGICHTDIGFLYGGVNTRKPPPIILGHEISGEVVQTGEGMERLAGKEVIIPAVLPCGECDLCSAGRGNICRSQKMPGNDFDGGFADYIVVPGRFLTVVPEHEGIKLSSLSVIADALSTPYMALKKAKVKNGDGVIFIGIGGLGGFGVQIASAMGAKVVAIDIDDERLEKIKDYGASLTINVRGMEFKNVRKVVTGFMNDFGLSPYGYKIFETSGTREGQELAFNLLTFASTLAIVGFTLDKVNIRLSNLMAFDAEAFGIWGCLPELYKDVVDMVIDGRVKITPFVQEFPLNEINRILSLINEHKLKVRPIVIPE